MFKIIAKIILLLTIFSLVGLGISKGLSFLEENVHLESYIGYFANRDDIEDELILDSIQGDVTVEENISEEIENYGVPTVITIDSVGIRLEVKEGVYDFQNMTWTLTNGYAYWANLSDSISSKGSHTVIYAHNLWHEFSRTKDLEVGDLIEIETSQGKRVIFEYVSDSIVNPNNGNVFFEDTDESQVVLITCSGVFSESRRIMYGALVEDSVVVL